MNIQIPKDMKSPTVLIMGQKEDNSQKYIDLLNEKIDKQYKMFVELLRNNNTNDKTVSVLSEKFDNLKNVFKEYLKKSVPKDNSAERFKAQERKIDTLHHCAFYCYFYFIGIFFRNIGRVGGTLL